MTNETRIQVLEDRIESLGEDTDPCDLYTVIAMIADYIDEFPEGFLKTSLYQDIISATQSNARRSDNRIRRMIRLDNAILRYQDED